MTSSCTTATSPTSRESSSSASSTATPRSGSPRSRGPSPRESRHIMTDLPATTELRDFLAHVNRGSLIEGGSPQHRYMHRAAQEALRIIADLNNGYRAPQEVRSLLA